MDLYRCPHLRAFIQRKQCRVNKRRLKTVAEDNQYRHTKWGWFGQPAVASAAEAEGLGAIEVCRRCPGVVKLTGGVVSRVVPDTTRPRPIPRVARNLVEWVDVEEAASRLGVSVRSVIMLSERGRVRTTASKRAQNPYTRIVAFEDVRDMIGLP